MMGLSNGPSSLNKNQEAAAITRQAVSANNDRESAPGRPRVSGDASGRGSSWEEVSAGDIVNTRMIWVAMTIGESSRISGRPQIPFP